MSAAIASGPAPFPTSSASANPAKATPRCSVVVTLLSTARITGPVVAAKAPPTSSSGTHMEKRGVCATRSHIGATPAMPVVSISSADARGPYLRRQSAVARRPIGGLKGGAAPVVESLAALAAD